MRIQQIKIKAQVESGQAIVILALVMVALLGFVGLVVDGGGLFFLQRDAQNATDAAVIAATYARCTNAAPADVMAAGYAAAEQNGFYNGYDGRTVVVNNPPINGEEAGNDNYIQVDITATKPSYFIQMVYRGPLQVSTRAVGYCLPPFDPSDLPAITGLADAATCTNTIKWSGSSATIRGGVFSNGDIQFHGSDNLIDGGADAAGVVDQGNNNTYVNGTPQNGVPSITNPLEGIFIIGDYAPGGTVATSIQASGGIYHAILSSADDPDYKDGNNTWDVDNRTLEGLYYVDGNVSLGNSVDFAQSPSGVSIVATGKISGNAVHATYYPPANGVLFWSNETTNCGTDAINMSGNNTQWHGLIYAPYGGISVSGSDLTLIGVVIGQTFSTDASHMLLVADPSVIPPRPPLVRVAE